MLPSAGGNDDQQGGNQHRYLHQDPAQLVVYHGTPALGTEVAVARLEVLQGHEDHYGQDDHHTLDGVEELGVKYCQFAQIHGLWF